MSSLFRPSSDVFSELNRLQGVLDQMMRPSGPSSIRALSGASFPLINVGSTPDAVEVLALAPGLDANALQISVDRGLLVIAGERPRSPPKGQGSHGGAEGANHSGSNGTAGGGGNGNPAQRKELSVYAQERFAGPFRRVLSLPEDADPAKVEAHYRDGVLRISIGRRESSRPRRIEVN